jgi:hypothetical protein
VIPLSLAPLDLSCHKDVTHGHYSPDIGPIAGCARHGHCEIMRRVTLDCLVPRSHYICHWLHVGVDDCILGRSSRLEQHLLPARRGLLEVLRDCIDYSAIRCESRRGSKRIQRMVTHFFSSAAVVFSSQPSPPFDDCVTRWVRLIQLQRQRTEIMKRDCKCVSMLTLTKVSSAPM